MRMITTTIHTNNNKANNDDNSNINKDKMIIHSKKAGRRAAAGEHSLPSGDVCKSRRRVMAGLSSQNSYSLNS